MNKTGRSGVRFARTSILVLACLFFLISTGASYARWADFQYRTFDLAFYAQAIWQFLHGRFTVTVEPIPLLGNHVEPIAFLIAPLLAIFQHPMVFVIVQNAALATMGPIGFDIANRLGLDARRSFFLAASLLIAPAAGYIALHEFHPEALTAPFLLMMLRARLIRSRIQHWVWFVAVLACKENMALLLATYCAVNLIVDRREGFTLRSWYLWPLVLAVIWLLICVKLIIPALNTGEIDYMGLYSQIGTSGRDILVNAFTKPQLIGKALTQGITHGNLFFGLLLPFLCLPLLAPRWLIISIPVLCQHLLSWRSSEWNIYFHYAAPLLPFFWFGTVEAIARGKTAKLLPARVDRTLPAVIVLACLAGQVWIGPFGEIVSVTADWFSGAKDRARKTAFVSGIPPQASIVAPFPYLSHLALREKLYSLHHILKGLKTLSRAPFEPPPPPDFVLIDYNDFSTFDPSSGYYHPTMRMTDGQIIPSSDQRLHELLKERSWLSYSVDELTLLQQQKEPVAFTPVPSGSGYIANLGEDTQLISVTKSGDTLAPDGAFEIKMEWSFGKNRTIFPWMFLKVTRQGDGKSAVFTRGLCAPEASAGLYRETWRVTSLDGLPEGEYTLESIFVNNTRRVWSQTTGKGQAESGLLGPPVMLGNLKIVEFGTSGKGTK